MERNYNVIILETPGSSYLWYFEYSIFLALKSMGCNVTYVPRENWQHMLGSVENLYEYKLIAECDFFISFNNLDNGLDIFDRLSKPLLSVCIDRPFHMKWSFDNKAANVLYLWSDENDLKYAPVYFHGGIHKFLPHAADLYPPPEDGLLFKERDIDVLVSCHYYVKDKSELYDSYNKFSGNYSGEIIEAITKRYLEGDIRLEDCVREVTNWDEDAVDGFMRADGAPVDADARYVKRYKVVKALVESGLNISCCGAFWEYSSLAEYPNFLRLGSVRHLDVQQLLGRAKMLVNTFPVSNVSAHERIFGSMLRGALCVTDPTDWLRKHFTDGESIVFYDPNDPESLTEKVAFYLNNEEERLRVTRNAMEIVLREHTWLTRAEEMLNIYEELTGRGKA